MIISNFTNKLRTQSHFRLSSSKRTFSLFSGIQAFEYIEGSPVNPSTIFAHTLETLNAISGFGWPATIVSFTLGMRLLIFPAYVKQTKATIMANNLKDEVNSFQTRIQTFRSKNQFPEARKELQEMYNFLRKNNCHPFRTISLSLLPVPFFMSTFFALRNMARQPIESFVNGGAGWFLNLAESDPFFILPVLSCASLLASFEISRKSNPSAIPLNMVNFLRALSLISVPILAYMPASLCIYFISTNTFTLVQNIALCIPKIRTALGIPNIISKHVNSNLKSNNFIENIKKALRDSKFKQSNEIIIHNTKPLKNI